MTYPNYPSSFQCPQVRPYSWKVDMGVLRTPMEGGNSRQRRRYRTMPHGFNLEFVMPALAVGQWQSWVNAFAYDWFTIKLESMWSAATGEITSPHLVRFISNLEFEDVVYGWVRVRVQAELSPNQIALGGPLLPTYNWIIGGTPINPSSGGSAATTWNPADKNPAIVLSNANLTATAGAGASQQTARATTAISANQRRFYSFVSDQAGSNVSGAGFANAVQSLTGYVGTTNAGIAWYPFSNTGGIFFKNTTSLVGLGTGYGSVVDFAIDTYLMRLWCRANGGNWNLNPAASPASGVGGIDISEIVLPVYPAMTVQGPLPGQVTATFAEPFPFPMPAGFSAVASAASNWILAGAPSSPATPDWIFAGTPQFPAAIVF